MLKMWTKVKLKQYDFSLYTFLKYGKFFVPWSHFISVILPIILNIEADFMNLKEEILKFFWII